MRRRRVAAALTLGASAALGIVSAYQFGLVRHLPEPPLGFLDSDRVDASGEAYWFGSTPDAPLGVASYAATLALVGMGTARRADEQPWIPVLAAAKVLADAANAGYLTVEQLSRHRRLCLYCVAAFGASLATIPQVLPEARAAWVRRAG